MLPETTNFKLLKNRTLCNDSSSTRVSNKQGVLAEGVKGLK